MEQLRSTRSHELSGIEGSLDARLEAAQAALDIYAANGFDVDAVSEDPSCSYVSEAIGASLQADVFNGTRDTREYCGIEV